MVSDFHLNIFSTTLLIRIVTILRLIESDGILSVW
jgi:hypothetical protein